MMNIAIFNDFITHLKIVMIGFTVDPVISERNAFWCHTDIVFVQSFFAGILHGEKWTSA